MSSYSPFQATLSIETLILKSKLTSDIRSAEIGDGVNGSSNVHVTKRVQSRNPSAMGGKLMNALIVFISDCFNLHSIIIDSLHMDLDFVSGLGAALTNSKSG